MTLSDKKLTAIDLFAGAGGFGLGFRLAGYETPFSLEIDEWAAQTLVHNNPAMTVIKDDICRYQSPAEIKAICPFSPQVIIGGPPSANRRIPTGNFVSSRVM